MSENGDWDQNRKLVLATLLNLGKQVDSVQEVVSKHHDSLIDKMDKMEENIQKREEKHVEQFVGKKEFAPVSKAVYGLAGLLITGVVLALLGLIIK